MKKCPYCQAEIEENARFCLYCMKPLVEKDQIAPPKKRRWNWGIVAAVLVVCIGIGALAVGLWKAKQRQTIPPTVSTQSSSQTAPDTSSTEPSQEDPSTEMPPDVLPEMVFSYREVAPGDGFPPGSDVGGVVITGIKTVSPNGEYAVPDHIDGKPVVGIMPLAFSGSDARCVTLGENILQVNANAFSGCFNIEVLRIKSKALFLSRSAFIDAAHRSCKLTICCSADCVVEDDLYGECYLKDIVQVYGGEYQPL